MVEELRTECLIIAEKKLYPYRSQVILENRGGNLCIDEQIVVQTKVYSDDLIMLFTKKRRIYVIKAVDYWLAMQGGLHPTKSYAGSQEAQLMKIKLQIDDLQRKSTAGMIGVLFLSFLMSLLLKHKDKSAN